jgi:carbon-monoxide dehydrogenase large subunit
LDACRKLKAEILASLPENSGNDIVIRDGEILLDRKKMAGLPELVAKKRGPFRAASEFAMTSVTFSSGAHLCGLLLDLETGRIRLKNYFAVDDCGKVINPVIVDGQMEGGIVHGIGSAILEEITFDQEGQPLTTNLVDYTIPTALDVPEDFELAHVETPSPISLNGAKGVGESGTIGACPAILNALNDALSVSGSEIDMAPATPERVFESMRKRG